MCCLPCSGTPEHWGHTTGMLRSTHGGCQPCGAGELQPLGGQPQPCAVVHLGSQHRGFLAARADHQLLIWLTTTANVR
jgi:hypothetical protein